MVNQYFVVCVKIVGLQITTRPHSHLRGSQRAPETSIFQNNSCGAHQTPPTEGELHPLSPPALCTLISGVFSSLIPDFRLILQEIKPSFTTLSGLCIFVIYIGEFIRQTIKFLLTGPGLYIHQQQVIHTCKLLDVFQLF